MRIPLSVCCSRLTVMAGVLLICGALEAAAAPPSLTTILPRGASRDSEPIVTLHGRHLDTALDMLFHDSGILLLEVIEAEDRHATVRLRIDADCPVGPQAVRVQTEHGVSNVRLFSIGALTEIEEAEPNNGEAEAHALALGVTVNGRVTGEDVDYFAVELTEGQTLAVEIEAIRLGDTLFDPKIRLFGPGGHERVSADDTPLMRQDTGFAYTAIETGTHLFAVSEAAYGGCNECYYRLHVGEFPRPLSATPLGGPPGEDIAVQWLGDPRFAPTEGDTAAPITVSLPQATGTQPVTVVMGEGTLPTPFPFRVSPLPVTHEVLPNNTLDTATLMTAPGAAEGVIAAPGETDFFAFEATNGAVYDIRVWARALGSPLDSMLFVYKPDGSALASDDDGASIDSTVRVTIPEDGLYRFTIGDHLARGGETFAYRVEVSPVESALSLALQDNEQACVAVPQGNRAFLLLRAERSGWDAPVEVALEGLPAGLATEPLVIPQGERIIPVILEAEAAAPVRGSLVNLVATPASPEIALTGRLSQRVRLVLGRNEVVFIDRELNHLALAVTTPAPYSIAVAPIEAPIVRNGVKHVRLLAERAEGFNGAISVKMPWAPAGFAAPEVTIPEGESEAVVALQARGDVVAGENRLVFEAKADGFAVCTPFVPITVEEPWVAVEAPALETEQGRDVEMVFAVAVNKAFEGAFAVSLNGLPRGLTAEPQEIRADSTEVRFPVTVAEDAPVGAHDNLQVTLAIRAQDEEVTHLGPGGSIRVYEPLPAALQEAHAEPAPEVAEGEPAPEPEPKRRTRFPQS